MRPGSNRSVYIFLGLCLLFLVLVISFIIFLNRPTTNDSNASPSPTPVFGSDRVTPRSADPSIPPVEGESGFTEEELQQFQAARQQADAAYQDRLQRMPFITKLPHTTTHYKIEITAVSDTIYITTYGPPSFQASYRAEALAWIEQNGGDIDTLTIQYKN